MNYIIGCGGVGSWLAPALARVDNQITLIDGDVFEAKNLERQLFTERAIGVNKAKALGDLYQLSYLEDWFHSRMFEPGHMDWLLVCVDNHTARREALDMADIYGCQVILAANETYGAEAMYYNAGMADYDGDPRVIYPELLTDTADDPRAASIGCTGLAAVDNPQLISANLMAASMALNLWMLHTRVKRTLAGAAAEKLPFRMAMTLSRLNAYPLSQAYETTKQRKDNDDNTSTAGTAPEHSATRSA